MTEISNGKPAPLQFRNPEEKAASADIVNAIENGDRVPNFAGHYFVIEGPNAPDYAQVKIVDLATGRIFQPPFAGQGWTKRGLLYDSNSPVQFQQHGVSTQ